MLGISEESKAYHLYNPTLRELLLVEMLYLKRIKFGVGVKNLHNQFNLLLIGMIMIGMSKKMLTLK